MAGVQLVLAPRLVRRASCGAGEGDEAAVASLLGPRLVIFLRVGKEAPAEGRLVDAIVAVVVPRGRDQNGSDVSRGQGPRVRCRGRGGTATPPRRLSHGAAPRWQGGACGSARQLRLPSPSSPRADTVQTEATSASGVRGVGRGPRCAMATAMALHGMEHGNGRTDGDRDPAIYHVFQGRT